MTLRCWFLGSQSRDHVAFGHFNFQAVCKKQKSHSEINFWPEKSRFLIWLMRYVSVNRDFVNQVSYDHRRDFVTLPKTVTFPKILRLVLQVEGEDNENWLLTNRFSSLIACSWRITPHTIPWHWFLGKADKELFWRMEQSKPWLSSLNTLLAQSHLVRSRDCAFMNQCIREGCVCTSISWHWKEGVIFQVIIIQLTEDPLYCHSNRLNPGPL